MNALQAALIERSHDGLVEDYVKLLAENYKLERAIERLSSPFSEAEWNGGCAGLGALSREMVNERLVRRGK